MPLTAGTCLGPYEIEAAVGAGGRGEVYRARDTRFEREARAVSSLNHPHICTLHDIGQQDGIHFLVMEYLEGEILSARLAKGPLATDELLRYAVQTADALEKAHRQGLIQRDLKPGNIMLTKAGAKLLDFGLAKSAAAPVSSGLTSAPTQTSPLTAAGVIVGTFQYMAPEQLEGKEADARSDIFAFGVVLYEMATGRKAFEGKTQASVIAAILAVEPPAVSTLEPLDRVIKICLAKDPDEQSIHDLYQKPSSGAARDELVPKTVETKFPPTGRATAGSSSTPS